MSLPSPKKKAGGNAAGPRQIRFVATDGQPQTKRRRVNAAYVESAFCSELGGKQGDADIISFCL